MWPFPAGPNPDTFIKWVSEQTILEWMMTQEAKAASAKKAPKKVVKKLVDHVDSYKHALADALL